MAKKTDTTEKYGSMMRLAQTIRADLEKTQTDRGKEVGRQRGLELEKPEADQPKPAKLRNIVICCDGTSNEFGELNTNVVKLFGLLKKDDPESQIMFYGPGVGTMSTPGYTTWFLKKFSVLLGLAFGIGISKNIEDAYRFLMNNYRGDTDRVYIFGFSRGAFTARALAGMLHRVGLLPKGSDNQIPYAMKMWRRKNKNLQAHFKDFFSRECVPYFVGVWDTVKTVGFFKRHRFPDAKLNLEITYGRQALSLDEKRTLFKPLPWTPDENAQPGRIEQQWFAGDHCGVGGGWPKTGLSDISLEWMLEQASADDMESKLLLIDDWQTGINPDPEGHLNVWPYRFYKLLPFYRRTISANADIHPSAQKRAEADSTYRIRAGQPVRWWERVLGSVPCFAALATLGAICCLFIEFARPCVVLAWPYIASAGSWIGERFDSFIAKPYAASSLWGHVFLWAGFAMLIGLAVIWLRKKFGGD